MKRRDFLVGSTGLVGALVPGVMRAEPCPVPTLELDGDRASTACGGSTLAQTAASLSPGDSTSFPAGSTGNVMDNADWAWQARSFWDPTHRLVQAMGKPAGGGTYMHQTWDEATARWTFHGTFDTNGTGHIYDNHAYDPSTGDLFCHAWNRSYANWYKKASDTWTRTATHDHLTSSPPSNGLVFHPNLFGPGEPGLLRDGRRGARAWNKASNSWSDIIVSHEAASQGACSFYSEKDDVAYFGGGATTLGLYRLSPGPTVETLGDLPLPCFASSSAAFGHLHPDPRNRSGILYFLDRTQNVGNRVWKSTNGGESFSLMPYTHPFESIAGNSIAVIPEYEVMWQVGERGTMLWKPDD